MGARFRTPPALQMPTFFADAAQGAVRRSAADSVAVTFDEIGYLARYPDAKRLIENGEFSSAEDHWLTFKDGAGLVGEHVLRLNPDFMRQSIELDDVEPPGVELILIAAFGSPDDALARSLLLQSDRSFSVVLVADPVRHTLAADAADALGLAGKLLSITDVGALRTELERLAAVHTHAALVFLDSDVELIPDAVRVLRRARANVGDGADAVYLDEGLIDFSGQRLSFRKPAWSPLYFLASAYACGLALFSSALIGNWVKGEPDVTHVDFSLFMFALEQSADIRHLPEVVSWSRYPLERTEHDLEEPRRRVSAFFEHTAPQIQCVVDGGDSYLPLVNSARQRPISIIIPTADRSSRVEGGVFNLLDRCVRSLSRFDPDVPKQFVLVHNDDMPAARRQELAMQGYDLVLFDAEEFNFSEKVNLGVAAAVHETLLILNDDVEATSDWLASSASWLDLSGVGAVGPRLVYPNGNLQHAGCGVLRGEPLHPFYRAPNAGRGMYAGLVDTVREVAAVTGACLLTTRKTFDDVGGFDQNLHDLYNDIDFCLKVREAGRTIIYDGRQTLVHLESVSLDPARKHGRQLELFRAKWGRGDQLDPYYNLAISRWRAFRWEGPPSFVQQDWAEVGGITDQRFA